MATVQKITNPARRGDLVVVEIKRRDYVIGQRTQARTEVIVMEVAGLFQDGRIRTVRSIEEGSGGYPQNLEGRLGIIGMVGFYLLPTALIDRDAALAALRAHRRPGHEDSSMIRPFDSLDEVRELIKPFRKTAAQG